VAAALALIPFIIKEARAASSGVESRRNWVQYR